MKITIAFNTNLEVFDVDQDSYEKINIKEVQGIINHVKNEVTSLIQSNYDYNVRLNDSNGNPVGYLKIESKKILEEV